MFCFLTSGDTGSFVWGGGGGGGGGEYFVRRLCFYVLFIVVLVLVVYSIFSLFRILVMFCFFSIACSCKWCLGLVLVYFASHSHVNESIVSCLCV